MKNKLKRQAAAAKRFAFYRERKREGAKPKGKSRRFMEAYYATLKPDQEKPRHE